MWCIGSTMLHVWWCLHVVASCELWLTACARSTATSQTQRRLRHTHMLMHCLRRSCGPRRPLGAAASSCPRKLLQAALRTRCPAAVRSAKPEVAAPLAAALDVTAGCCHGAAAAAVESARRAM